MKLFPVLMILSIVFCPTSWGTEAKRVSTSDLSLFEAISIEKVDLRENISQDAVLLEIVLDRPIEPKIFFLGNPSRVVVDVPSTYNRSLPMRIAPANTEIIKCVRLGYHPHEGFNRFVFDVNSGLDIEASHYLYNPHPSRLTTRLFIRVHSTGN